MLPFAPANRGRVRVKGQGEVDSCDERRTHCSCQGQALLHLFSWCQGPVARAGMGMGTGMSMGMGTGTSMGVGMGTGMGSEAVAEHIGRAHWQHIGSMLVAS